MSATTAPSIRASLRPRAFRALLGGGTVYFIGNAMQAMAAAWLMVELTGSSFLAALVQTAVFLPMFLLSLPAGVLADTTDRRRLMLAALLMQAALVALLAAAAAGRLGRAGDAAVVHLRRRLLHGAAVAGVELRRRRRGAARRAAAGDHRRGDRLQQRARARPRAGRLRVRLVGGGWVFVLAVVSTLADVAGDAPLAAARRIRRRACRPSACGAACSARCATRGTRRSILAQLVRTVAYSAAGSALWALLPVIGQRQLGLGAAGFGLLMGCLGAGAVGGRPGASAACARGSGWSGWFAPGCVVFARRCWWPRSSRWPLAGLRRAGGRRRRVDGGDVDLQHRHADQRAAVGALARRCDAHAVRAGSFAIGSAFWGAVSGLSACTVALLIARRCAWRPASLLARPFPLRMGEAHDVTPAALWEDLFVAARAGTRRPARWRWRSPIASAPSDAAAFLDAVSQLRAPRRRDGATFWRVYRDLGDPSRYVERFIVT